MLQTDRLLLREWRAEDRDPFAALNADAEVMRHFRSTLTRDESDSLADGAAAHLVEHGWGLWAVEVISTGTFIGFTGLNRPSFDAHFTPAIEVGWRLARAAWGFGYATEAARAAVDVAFDPVGGLGLAEVVSFTTVDNARSRAVMRRLGMTHDPADDFDSPSLPPGHPQRPHVLHRLQSPALRDRSSPCSSGAGHGRHTHD